MIQGSAVVLYFPGQTQIQDTAFRLLDEGELTGKLYFLAEQPRGNAVTARIRPLDGGNAVLCTANHDVGLKLREHLFEAVRIRGQGTWARSDAGDWTCESMHISGVMRITNANLRQAIDALRAIEVEWPEDPIGELAALNG